MSEDPGTATTYAAPAVTAPAVIDAVKAASTARTSAVLAADPELVLSFGAGEYDFSAMLDYEGGDGGRGGLRFSWVASTGAMFIDVDGTDLEGSPAPRTAGGREDAVRTTGEGKRCSARMSGRLHVAEPGALSLGWGVAVPNGVPTILHGGSWARLVRAS